MNKLQKFINGKNGLAKTHEKFEREIGSDYRY
jgi:hypothetical protein